MHLLFDNWMTTLLSEHFRVLFQSYFSHLGYEDPFICCPNHEDSDLSSAVSGAVEEVITSGCHYVKWGCREDDKSHLALECPLVLPKELKLLANRVPHVLNQGKWRDTELIRMSRLNISTALML